MTDAIYPMSEKHPKANRKFRRKLGAIAWERELRFEILKLGDAIRAMEAGELTPFEVNDRIHEFHQGASRDLESRFLESDPGIAVYRAYYDGFLTEEDLAGATDEALETLHRFVEIIRENMRDQETPAED
ncbi:hypothetical protein [Lignipirellula cremea]|uniref:Uncharacterized protein n=1 Tax=Lignipirellula cremea TaxID=2528010 RepID=A0A518E323_9BACT|nr:hypothetical protein [Lignipirellula cremea]QDU98487.1 hypothetical protein Pla8534_63560 [Lignipirellula cremea]